MEQYRQLYKNNPALNLKNKRQEFHRSRAAKRDELYSSTRNISLSPTPKKQQLTVEHDKENFKPPHLKPGSQQVENAPNDARAPTAMQSQSQPTKMSEKQSRQKAYLMRFLAWKAEQAKQKELNADKKKRAPFVVPTSNTAQQAVEKKSTFASKSNVFKPPANLKDVTLEIIGKNAVRCINGKEESIFTFTETPKKKQNVDSKILSAKAKIVRPLSSLAKPTVHRNDSIPKAVAKATPPATTLLKQKIQTPMQKPPTGSSLRPTTSATNGIKPIQSKTPIQLKMPPPQQSSVKPINKPASNIQKPRMPPPPQPSSRIIRRPQPTSVPAANKLNKPQIVKSGMPPIKRPTFKASKKPKTNISQAFITMKGKTSNPPPALKLDGKTLLPSTSESKKLAEPIPETPTDCNPDRSYINFLTSTKRKSASLKDLRVDLIFADLGNTISPVDVEANEEIPIKEKFNPLRYSVVYSDKKEPAKPEEVMVEVKSEKKEPEEEVQATPEKTVAPPTTYLSPYVSVSRGKVNTKIEREKRNSIYMVPDDTTKSPETTAEVRRTLATVRYYRKQLADEIDRLHVQCNNWEQYKEENAELIENCGVDMINVTIGQTRLLTTKKLKQFGGLIDRCEDGILGKTVTCNGGGEGAKAILPEDLEGFWSMVGLQIENVEKRFSNLERWKANNWADPDEIVPNASNSLAKVKKPKKRKPAVNPRPNGELHKMLRAAHAAYLKKKTVGDADNDIILTPSKPRQVLIMNRRSRSSAATVITVNTPTRANRKSSPLCQSINSADGCDTPKQLPQTSSYRKTGNLLKTALLNGQEKKSPLTMEGGSPSRTPMMSRKSILKTPGSVSRPGRSVVFNSPQFVVEDTIEESQPIQSEKQRQQEEEDQRTYKLRNRRIVLRDSREFEIPK